MQKVSLFDLNEYIKRVIALNFQEPIWVHAEISQANEVRGQVYLDLVHHDDDSDEITAQAYGVIWYKSHLFLKNKLKELLPSILKVGSKVLVKARIDFNERYGLKLVIEDIDPSYTIGQMEMNRQRIMQELQNAGVTRLNKAKPLPKVIQSVAIISSETAAGFKDFMAQLSQNEYGYAYRTTLFQAAMQGQNTEREVCNALDTILTKVRHYDCVVIIRGGGSKLDLSAFDNYNIGHKIATFPIPVYTGIGHEIDNCVADLVAHTSFKTPTAVASAIVDKTLHFESEILQIGQSISQFTHQITQFHRVQLDHAVQILQLRPQAILATQQNELELQKALLRQETKSIFQQKKYHLESAAQIIQLSDPEHILKKGYSMVLKGDKIITTANELNSGDTITIKYYDGHKLAEIKS